MWKFDNSAGTWQSMTERKYLSKVTFVWTRSGFDDSHFWKGLMNVNHTFQIKMLGDFEGWCKNSVFGRYLAWI